MDERPKIECDIHDVLDKANAMMLMGITNIDKAKALIAAHRIGEGGHVLQKLLTVFEHYVFVRRIELVHAALVLNRFALLDLLGDEAFQMSERDLF